MLLNSLGGIMVILRPLFLLSFVSIHMVAVATECGIRGGTPGSMGNGIPQIVGGTNATALEFPWMISLRFYNTTANYERGHTCGGSIINEQHVMTAAHCVTQPDSTKANYIVVIGDQNLLVQDPYEERIGSAEITVHPLWNPSTLNYDYAIIKLNKTLNFTGQENHLMPICLPTLDQGFDGQICTTCGWGLTKDRSQGGKSVNPDLLKVDLPIVPHAKCESVYRRVKRVDINTMICAGTTEGGKSTCQGDSGGPLMCARPDGRYVLAGLTSWAGTCGAPNTPRVFARVSTRLAWIREVAGPTP